MNETLLVLVGIPIAALMFALGWIALVAAVHAAENDDLHRAVSPLHHAMLTYDGTDMTRTETEGNK